MKKAIALSILAVLIFSSVFVRADTDSSLLAAPEFSVKGGIYSNEIMLSLSGGADIYYTTDGSVPTKYSTRYKGAFIVGAASTPMFGRPDEEPTSVPAAVTIRAAVINENQTSPVASETYLIGENAAEYFGSVPIVSLIASPYDLWDWENGIYSNYEYEHKVPAVFQYITTDGVTDINRTVEIKVSGHGSRSAPKKSLRVYFKKTDPEQGKYLEYNLIPDSGVTTISKVTLRISDWQSTNLRDVLAQKIGAFTRADTAESEPMAVFLNGQYWGLYECREQYDDDYVAAHYSIDNDNVVSFGRDWTMEPMVSTMADTGTTYIDKMDYSSGPADGNPEGLLGESYYREQWDYIKSLAMERDITSDEIYGEFCDAVDIDNFIDYIIVYIYSANDDWPGNNFEMWRVTQESIDPQKYGADGKWRFMIHDFDIAFENPNHTTLALSALEKGAADDARHPEFATALLDGLLKNATFRAEFAQRTMAYLSTAMSGDNIDKILTELVDERKAGKEADLARWSFGPPEERLNRWLRQVDNLRRYGEERPNIMINQYRYILNDFYGAGITGTAVLNISSVPSGTSLEISGAIIDETAYSQGFSTVQFAGIPVTVKASPQAEITITGGESTLSGEGEITFTPEKDAQYSISLQEKR